MQQSSYEDVESFVWKNNDTTNETWRIEYRKASRIYDSDPHSLKIPNSHVAWKKELLLTRFANQELPEALWGSNFLSLTYYLCEDDHEKNSTRRDSRVAAESQGVRISFCALEALRTWALMDMDLPVSSEEKKNDREEDKQTNGTQKPAASDLGPIDQQSARPTIIPHKSGRIPDPWDYTFTTNYAGSIQWCSSSDPSYSVAKQPDQTTLYSIRVGDRPKTSRRQSQTITNHKANVPSVELRPPMCKCVGGRMICAGVVPNATIHPKPSVSLTKTDNTIQTDSFESGPPRPSPKWIPYSKDDDGPLDVDGLLQSERSPPLHYTGVIPLWIQNLDPQSYSFVTITAIVCKGSNRKSFMVVLLRCFVRVNGVKVRLLDTKFLIRQKSCTNGATVILRERSWKEGTWDEYTAGMKQKGILDLGTDLEQGKRASRNLQHKIPPIMDKMVLCDDANASRSNRGGLSNELWRRALPKEWNITKASSSESTQGMVPLVINKHKIVALDAYSGELLWEHDLTATSNKESVDKDRTFSASILSLAVSTTTTGKDRIVIGDDRGCVHVLRCTHETLNIEQETFHFRNERSNRNVKQASLWVEKVVWSNDGEHFAAAAGRNLMIDGRIIKFDSTIYDFSFLPPEMIGSGARGDRYLGIAQYGGLEIVDVEKMEVLDKVFSVGSTAVLSFAASPDGQSIAIGCLDKRLRLFQRRDAGQKQESLRLFSPGVWTSCDWIGFDGGVSSIGFALDSKKLGAIGGTKLVVMDLDSEWGEAPTLCSLWVDENKDKRKNTGKRERIRSFAWNSTDILIASTDRFLYSFDVRATVDTVPKRCYPVDKRRIEKGFSAAESKGKVVLWEGTHVFRIAV